MTIEKIANKVFNNDEKVLMLDLSFDIKKEQYPFENYQTVESHLMAELSKAKQKANQIISENKQFYRVSDYLISYQETETEHKFVVLAEVKDKSKEIINESLALKLNRYAEEKNIDMFSDVKQYFFARELKNETEEEIFNDVTQELDKLNMKECDWIISREKNINKETKTIKVNGEDYEDKSPRYEDCPVDILKINVFYKE